MYQTLKHQSVDSRHWEEDVLNVAFIFFEIKEWGWGRFFSGFLSCFCGSLGFYLLNDAVFESILCFQELF